MDRSDILCVAQLHNEEEGGWNRSVLNRLCDQETVEHIYKIQLSPSQTQDKLLWKGLSSKGFSVRACYDLA